MPLMQNCFKVVIWLFSRQNETTCTLGICVHLEITSFEMKLVPFLHAIMKLCKIYAIYVKLRSH